MDEGRAQRLGSRPIAAELAAIRASKSRSTLAAQMGRNPYGFEATFFDIAIAADLKNSKRYAVYLSQDGIGLPDRDYYLQSEFAEQKAAYQAYVANILNQIKWPEADRRASDIVALETRIAEVSWTKVQDRDVDATYNPVTIAELVTLAPGFDWHAFLASAHLSTTTRVIVAERTAFPKIATAFAQAPMATLQAWQAFHVADNAAPYLSKRVRRRLVWSAPQNAVGSGTVRANAGSAPSPPSAATTSAENDRFGNFGTLGWGVGQLYTAQYFPPEAKAKIESLVSHLKASYHRRLEKLDWMGPQTRAEALKKLDTYTVKVGYPDHPRDYTSLVIRDDDLVGDVRRVAAADWAFYVDRLPSPVDRSDWSMTPQTNNAYNGLMRDIVFPAGILQSPIFDANADAAINYGAIGGVIGHELTHGFDDQGRKIDAGGELRDWWTAEDAASFKSRAAKLGAAILRIPAARERCRRAHQWRSDDGREHRRPRRPDPGARCLSRLAGWQASAGDRRAHRRSARVPGLGAGLVRQGDGRLCAQTGGQRSAQPASLPRQRRRAQYRRLVRGVRGGSGRQALHRA